MREIASHRRPGPLVSLSSKGLTPEKLASIFLEADGGDVYRQAELFEEMEEKDTHLFSEFQKRKNAVLSFDYDVQPYSEAPKIKRSPTSVRDIIYGLPNSRMPARSS